jgi:hypothetical protein
MASSDSGIDQIERAGFDALLLFFKCSRRTTHRFATESEKRRICSFASETLVETPLLPLTVSPPRKRQHHHKACYDKSKNNGKTIELGKGDNTRQFQAQQAKGKDKTDTPSSKQRPRCFHW